ncbi:MAG TPA: hypothetical protein VD735_00430, partial [Candidatus Saccharimonadales bacterium]|nr:hypothetical protein [Candidatus Saccharimonadales bacterium]
MELPHGMSYQAMQAAIHGNTDPELPFVYRTSTLTPEDAARLNDAFDFQIVGGTHGWPNGRGALSSPTDTEYDAVVDATAVLDADRGDVLFVEGPGRDGEMAYRVPHLTDPAELRRHAEEQRDERTIDAFAYATILAAARGIPAMHADIGKWMMVTYLRGVGASSLRPIMEVSSEHY